MTPYSPIGLLGVVRDSWTIPLVSQNKKRDAGQRSGARGGPGAWNNV
jgi:hypothetical protein